MYEEFCAYLLRCNIITSLNTYLGKVAGLEKRRPGSVLFGKRAKGRERSSSSTYLDDYLPTKPHRVTTTLSAHISSQAKERRRKGERKPILDYRKELSRAQG